GVSVDQVIASQIGSRTRLPSLELGCEHGRRAGSCDSGYSCAYSSNISWRDEDTPLPKVVDPGAAFERMFGDIGESSANRWHMRRRASILDYVREDARRLEGRLGAADRRKLDEFQESVREIERRVQQAQAEQADLPDVEVPTGIPREASRHIDLMYDMLLLAFRMDVTRVSTLMVGTGGSNRTFPEIGVMDGHHHLSHHRNNTEMVEKIRRIDAFYTERFASFVERMRSTPEGEGSLLDSCMIMYGSGICDGNRHNHENLPIIMAGRGGGAMTTGSFVEFKRETPLCDLYLSIIRSMGCEADAFGDSRGTLL
ncbi:MAG: DUF1552 domain-containing protein, partial [Phycisphaerales bacterium]|nr:DUF1552 domain-containing protein [Phycisphaerales bacterium]